VDNGDGTITDTNTGLMWEKLSANGAIHDYRTPYIWDNAFAVKVATLNGGGGFAGHTDWRLPNLTELESIRNLEDLNPAVSPAFSTGCMQGCVETSCSCTLPGLYWSSSSYAINPSDAWLVYFLDGSVGTTTKVLNYYVQAVRGGL